MKILTLRSILWSFLLLSFSLSAQDAVLYGVVFEDDFVNPLPFASIATKDAKYGTVADFDGNYRLELPSGEHKIVVSYMGYETKNYDITIGKGEEKKKDFTLGESAQTLKVTVVTGSLFEKDLERESVSVDVISKETVANSNSRELGEAISRNPGVQMQDGQISIRGGNSYSYGVGTRTAVLVDGISYASADLGEATLKFAPMENTEQIEIVKGASSVVYGSSALSGVVNVRTAWPTDEKPEFRLNTYFGVYGKPPRDLMRWWSAGSPFYNGFTFNFSQKIKRTSVVVGSAMDFSQSYLQTNNEFRLRMNFKTKYQFKKKENMNFGINGNVMKENSDRFFLAPDSEFFPYRYSEGSEDQYVYITVSPHFTLFTGKGHKFNATLSYFNKWRKGNGNDVNASNNRIDLHPQYQYNWRQHIIITTGLPLQASISKSNLFQEAGNLFTAQGSGYVQVEGKYKELSAQVGIRVEANAVDTFGVVVLPVFRSGLNYKFGKATFLRASWGQGFRVPTLGERSITAEFITGVVFIFPNADLITERSWNLETGVKQGFKIGENWEGFFDFAMFLQEFKNLVEFRFGLYSSPDRSGLGLKAFNVDNARIGGYETSLAGRGSIGPVKLQGLVGYTYTYPANLGDTQQGGGVQQGNPEQQKFGNYMKNFFRYMFTKIEDDPTTEFNEVNNVLQFRSRHLIRGDVQADYKKFMLGFTLGWNSVPERVPELFKLVAQKLEADMLNDPNTALLEFDETSVGRYYRLRDKGDYQLDVRFGYQLKENIKIGLVIKNIMNREYYTRPYKVEPPRAFVLTMQAKF